MAIFSRRTRVVAWVLLLLASGSYLGLDAHRAHHWAPRAPVARPQHERPLIGTNYTHYAFSGCSMDGGGIVSSYHLPGVRERVQNQLVEMRSRDLETMRILLWHISDIAHHRWGVIPSDGGELRDVHSRNLRGFIDDVSAAGFFRVTVSFAPMWESSPYSPHYDTASIASNWRFIASVREVLESSNIRDFRVDLLNEGAPSSYLPRSTFKAVSRYIMQIYRRYVDAYGEDDVTVSAIGNATKLDSRGQRLRNLVSILKRSGRQPPSVYEIHVNFFPEQVEYALIDADGALTSMGVDGVLIVGEAPLDDRRVARAMVRASSSMARRLEEVVQWYKRPTVPCEANPPYSADAYVDAFNVR